MEQKSDVERESSSWIAATGEGAARIEIHVMTHRNFVSQAEGISITKSLTWSDIFCFITNHFGLHLFPESLEVAEYAKGRFCRASTK